MKRADRLAWLALVVVSVALHWRFLAGDALIAWDLTSTVAPWQRDVPVWNSLQLDMTAWEMPYSLNHARRGGDWNPGLALGHPEGVFDLPNHHDVPALGLHALFEPWVAKGLASLLHIAAAGVGMYHYLRWRGAGARAALLGAVAWQLAPANTRLLEVSTQAALAAWTPFALWTAERAAASLSARQAAVAALVLAGATLHGLLSQFGLLLYVVTGALMLARGPRRPRLLAITAAVLVGAALLSAVRLLPMAATLADGARGKIDWSEYFARTAALGPEHLLLLVVPDALGSPLRGVTLAPGPIAQPYVNYIEVLLYVGLPVLVLALAGLRRGRLAPACLALAALLVAFPTPLTWLPHTFLPGFGSSGPTRALWVLQLMAPLLAAAGCRDLLAGSRRPAQVAVVVAALTAAVCIALTEPRLLGRLLPEPEPRRAAALVRDVYSLRAPGRERGDLPAWVPVQPVRGEGRVGLLLAPTLGPLLLGTGLAVALVLGAGSPIRRRAGAAAAFGLLAFEHLHSGITFNATSDPAALFTTTPGVARALEEAHGGRVLSDRGTLPNLLLPHGARDLCSYTGLVPGRTVRLLEALAGPAPMRQLVLPRALAPRWRDALAVRVVLTAPGVAPTESRGLTLLHGGPDLAVWTNPTALPRARLHAPGSVVTCATEAEALARVRAADFDPVTQVVIETASPWPTPTAPEPATPATILEDAPDRVVIDVDAPRGGVLVLADAWSRGWTATASDGARLETLPADVALRGVVVPAGFRGRVTWEYGLPRQALGWVITILAVGAALVTMRS